MNHEIHEVHEKQETLADIRKEVEGRFRKLCIEHVYGIGHLQAMQEFNHVFDRIEAAWKRERGEIEQRAIDHTTAHMDAVHRDNCRDCVCRTPVGNSAAMREALEYAIERAEEARAYLLRSADTKACMEELINKCRAAIGAAPLDCDNQGEK